MRSADEVQSVAFRVLGVLLLKARDATPQDALPLVTIDDAFLNGLALGLAWCLEEPEFEATMRELVEKIDLALGVGEGGAA